MLLELLAAVLLCSGGCDTDTSHAFDAPVKKNRFDDFEEADSFYDRHVNEHIVDDEGYCEDCDDYHDDY